MAFQAGYDKHVKWNPDHGGGETTVNITGWSEDDGTDALEVTHTGTNGHQAFIAGLGRCSCQIDLNYDTAATPESIGLRSGAKGTFTFKTGSDTEDSIHVIIEKVGKKSAVNGVVSVSITAKSDAIDDAGEVVDPVTFM